MIINYIILKTHLKKSHHGQLISNISFVYAPLYNNLLQVKNIFLKFIIKYTHILYTHIFIQQITIDRR